MYRIEAELTIDGAVAQVWATATDVGSWAAWDPHEQAARLDGEFVVGAVGWSRPHGGPATDWTLTDVVEQRRWASECALPGGKLTGVTTYEPVGEGRVRCAKTIDVTGPLVPLFRLWFGRRIRRDLLRTWTALSREAARRAAVA